MKWQKLRFWRRRNQLPEPLSYHVLAEHHDHTPEGDAQVVDGLRQAGADLSKRREVIHYFYFPNIESAESVAVELRRNGFDVEDPLQIAAVEEAASPWRALATSNVVVTAASAQETTERFRTLASRYGGEYDRWEAAAKP